MKTIFFALILLTSSYIVTNSQTVNNETCLPVSVVFQLESSYNTNLMGVNIGTVDYRYSVVGNVVDFSIDWSSLTNKNSNMSESAIRDFIINELIRKHTVSDSSNTSDTTYFNVYYKEDCYKDVTCTYQIETPLSTSSCCQDPSDISFFVAQLYSIAGWGSGFKFFDIKKKEFCGIKCCKDTYTAYKYSGRDRILIQRIQGQGNGNSLTDCSTEEDDFHCLKKNSNGTSVRIPCEDEGCHQWR